jgi:hypothetical protein
MNTLLEQAHQLTREGLHTPDRRTRRPHHVDSSLVRPERPHARRKPLVRTESRTVECVYYERFPHVVLLCSLSVCWCRRRLPVRLKRRSPLESSRLLEAAAALHKLSHTRPPDHQPTPPYSALLAMSSTPLARAQQVSAQLAPASLDVTLLQHRQSATREESQPQRAAGGRRNAELEDGHGTTEGGGRG